MKKEIFALCLIAFLMIAFAPPGQSNSPPVKQDLICYVIDQPAVQTVSVMETVEVQYVFQQVPVLVLSPFCGITCGTARNWPGLNDLSYATIEPAVAHNLQTFHNSMGVNCKTTLNKPVIHYLPRDGLSMAAA